MAKYKCRNCGYTGRTLIFQFDTSSYCIATNAAEPEYISEELPAWVRKKGVGEAEIGEPVGCPRCKSWGDNNFETVS